MKQVTSVQAKKSAFNLVPRLSSFLEPSCSMGTPVTSNLVMPIFTNNVDPTLCWTHTESVPSP